MSIKIFVGNKDDLDIYDDEQSIEKKIKVTIMPREFDPLTIKLNIKQLLNGDYLVSDHYKIDIVIAISLI
jgi:ERCC4-type nuclease